MQVLRYRYILSDGIFHHLFPILYVGEFSEKITPEVYKEFHHNADFLHFHFP